MSTALSSLGTSVAAVETEPALRELLRERIEAIRAGTGTEIQGETIAT